MSRIEYANAASKENGGTSSGEDLSNSSDSHSVSEGSRAKLYRMTKQSFGLRGIRALKYMKKKNVMLEVLCGITVALALVPEAVAFALSAGLTPSIGLHSAWVVAFVTAILGGRPAMICGATGALAVLVGSTVTDHGVEYLFIAVILMGVIELLLGLLRVGSLIHLIPTPVMIGFCNGLAIVIGLAQFNNFKVVGATGEAGGRRMNVFEPFTNGTPFLSGVEAIWAGVITIISFSVCMLLPMLSKKVPSALVAIAVGTLVEWVLVRTVFDSGTPLIYDIAAIEGSFPLVAWWNKENDMPKLNLETLKIVFPLSITMAAVGLLESLMTLNLIDEITETRGNPTRECIAQGVANIICGTLGGMGGCAMIGQSMINIGSGARSRVSSATAGLILLLIVMVASPAINIIPVSSLVGVMFNVVFHTFEWSSLKLMLFVLMPLTLRERCFPMENKSKRKIRRADAFVILIVTVVTALTDLAIAVGVGIVVAALLFVYDSATLLTVESRLTDDPKTCKPVRVYDVHGVLFFGSCKRFLSFFDEKTDPEHISISFNSGYISDYSAIETLNKIGEKYGALGKTVSLQRLKPGSSKLIHKSLGLLVKEVTVKIESEEVLPGERDHLNVERRDLDPPVRTGADGSLDASQKSTHVEETE